MALNELEKLVIKHFFSMIDLPIKDEESFFTNLVVTDREFTGKGFLTELDLSENLSTRNNLKTQDYWGALGAILNSTIDTGYLLYIEEGYLRAIEGYTYGRESWPDIIQTTEFYTIDEEELKSRG